MNSYNIKVLGSLRYWQLYDKIKRIQQHFEASASLDLI